MFGRRSHRFESNFDRNFRRMSVGIGAFQVFVLLGVVSVFALVIASRVVVVTHANDPNVEQEARAWAQGLGMQVVGVQCSSMDTDGDGYISCSVSYQGQGGITVAPVECMAGYLPGSGCRMQKPVGYHNRYRGF